MGIIHNKIVDKGTRRQLPRWRQVPLHIAYVMLLPLCGCQGMYVHNADRAEVAAVAKKNIDSIDVASIVKTEDDNLVKILAEEIKSIDARSKLVATLSTIQLAASDSRVADHYRQSLGKMRSALGSDNLLEIRNARACRINRQNAVEQHRNLFGILTELGAREIPACANASTTNIEKPSGLPDRESEEIDDTFKKYVKNCAEQAAKCQIAEKEANELEEARRELAKTNDQANKDKSAFDQARNEYKAALEANLKRTQVAADAEQNIRGKAQAILDKLNKLAESSRTLADQVKGAALLDLLAAAASGKTDANTDPDLAPAMEIAKSFPALVGSIEKAQAARATVPVSHLLLALNDLAIQADRDARVAALREEEISVLERKLAVRETQADLWRRYSDQLCNLALLGAGKPHPGKSCAKLDFSNSASNALTCNVRFTSDPADQPEVVNDCLLRHSWRQLFEAKLGSPEKRALYEAAAAYLHVRLLAYRTTGEEFKRIDVGHRRTVVEREAALLQWKNLVTIPTEEINGYYSGGIKPAELSDLIVKALGFTAIAVGVAK